MRLLWDAHSQCDCGWYADNSRHFHKMVRPNMLALQDNRARSEAAPGKGRVSKRENVRETNDRTQREMLYEAGRQAKPDRQGWEFRKAVEDKQADVAGQTCEAR